MDDNTEQMGRIIDNTAMDDAPRLSDFDLEQVVGAVKAELEALGPEYVHTHYPPDERSRGDQWFVYSTESCLEFLPQEERYLEEKKGYLQSARDTRDELKNNREKRLMQHFEWAVKSVFMGMNYFIDYDERVRELEADVAKQEEKIRSLKSHGWWKETFEDGRKMRGYPYYTALDINLFHSDALEIRVYTERLRSEDFIEESRVLARTLAGRLQQRVPGLPIRIEKGSKRIVSTNYYEELDD